MAPEKGEVTRLLEEHRRGDPGAVERLMPLLYDELRRLAAYYLRAERGDHTLQPTALVHEAYVKLAEGGAPWQDRAHFFALAARVMRNILVDHARAKRAGKRGGAFARVPLEEALEVSDGRGVDLIALEEALGALERVDAQQGRVVELRYFGGLSVEEAAEVLGVSPATVKREWAMAKAWLRRELQRES